MSAPASSPVGGRWQLLADSSPTASQGGSKAQEPVPPPAPPDIPPPDPAEVPPGHPPDELPPMPPDELPPREDPPEIKPPPEDPPPAPDEGPEPPPQRVGRSRALAGGYDEWPNAKFEL